MQIGDDQAALFEILARATGARRAVEIGTFTGYSSLALARGLGPDGRLLCCDVSEEWTAIARAHWEKAGVADRMSVRPAAIAALLFAACSHDAGDGGLDAGADADPDAGVDGSGDTGADATAETGAGSDAGADGGGGGVAPGAAQLCV